MIHNTAIIDKSAVIGQNVEIGPYVVIGEDVTIGNGTVIAAHATIECARIGQNCKIFSHASVGAPPQDLKYAGEKTVAIIGDGTTIREFATVNRGTSASKTAQPTTKGVYQTEKRLIRFSGFDFDAAASSIRFKRRVIDEFLDRVLALR